MPKITVRYDSSRFNVSGLISIYDALALKVASAAHESFSISDIDYYTYENGPFSHAPALAIEIQTIGWPERKTRMNASVLSWRIIIEELHCVKKLNLSPRTPLIWIQYVDPEGLHV